MKKVMPTAVLLLLLFLVGACCKDDPDNPVISDPCANVKPAVQNFNMYLSMTGVSDSSSTKFLIPEQLDTLYYDPYGNNFFNNITFEDTESAVIERSWKVGNDARTFTAQKFNLNFSNVMQGQAKEEIEVTLLRQRNANKGCLPNDDGIDTIRKKLLIVDARFYPLPQYGSYRIHPKGRETDTFTINIGIYQRDPTKFGYYFIKNFPKGATRGSSIFPDRTGDMMSFFGNYFRFDTDHGISEIEGEGDKYGFGYVKNGRIYIEYKLGISGTIRQYEGIKL